MNPLVFLAVNVAFISLAQSLLLFLIVTPTYVLLVISKLGVPLSTADTVFPRILLGLIVFEFFADQQQWGMFIEELSTFSARAHNSLSRFSRSQEVLSQDCKGATQFRAGGP
jgi:hypothetical protein